MEDGVIATRLFELEKQVDELFKQNWYLNYKIEKAIEYINTHYLNANEPELLNILIGGDKE